MQEMPHLLCIEIRRDEEVNENVADACASKFSL